MLTFVPSASSCPYNPQTQCPVKQILAEKEEEETVKETLPCGTCPRLFDFAAAYLRRTLRLGKNERGLLARFAIEHGTPMPISQLMPWGKERTTRIAETKRLIRSIKLLEKRGLVTTSSTPTIISQSPGTKPEIRDTLWAWPTALGRAAAALPLGRSDPYKSHILENVIGKSRAGTTSDPRNLFSLYCLKLSWLLSVVLPLLPLADPRTRQSPKGKERETLYFRASEHLRRISPEHYQSLIEHIHRQQDGTDPTIGGANPAHSGADPNP
jgi:hypothetical protein